jgi:hypothetical protein
LADYVHVVLAIHRHADGRVAAAAAELISILIWIVLVTTDLFLLGAYSGTSRPVIYMPFVENTFRALVGTIYGLLDEFQVQQVRKQYDYYSYATQMTIRSI